MQTGDPHTNLQAVIDIGSNSVRLVIFEVGGQALLPYYNEKVMAGLGVGVPETGHLPAAGIVMALKALKRFKLIIEGLKIETVHAVATAAIRAAKDGPDFVRTIKRDIGFDVDIIKGAEEARLSGLGVCGGMHKATGLVGDLGGSSLEFCVVKDGQIQGKGESLMLGPLSMDIAQKSPAEQEAAIDEILKQAQHLRSGYDNFYLVGGAWRALAKLHMDVYDYPLRLLHGYQMDAPALDHIVELTQDTSEAGLERRRRASQRRQANLPYAALLLRQIFKAGKFTNAVTSSYGLREGLIFSQIPKPEVPQILLEGLQLTLLHKQTRLTYGTAMYHWIRPLLTETMLAPLAFEKIMRLVRAACMMAESGAFFHPEQRANLAFETILRGQFYTLTHAERIFLAAMIGYRYHYNFKLPSALAALLHPRQKELSRILGAALRLGSLVSGRSSNIFDKIQLKLTDDTLSLLFHPAIEDMLSNKVERRLETLAHLMGRHALMEKHPDLAAF